MNAEWQQCRRRGKKEKERDKRDRESQSEGGGEWVVFMVKHCDYTVLLRWGLLESYISERSLEERQWVGKREIGREKECNRWTERNREHVA